MGMFDYVKVSGESFRCSEGHDLAGEAFQTKDLQCIMGTAHVDESGPFRFEYGGWGPDDFPANFSGEVEIYAGCPECPAFVQGGTLNFCDRSVDFTVRVVEGRVVKVTRHGGTLAEWVAQEQKQPWMAGALGPIPRADAYAIHSRNVPIPGALAEGVRKREEEWTKRDAERKAEEAAPELAIEARIAAAVAAEREKYARELQQALTRIENLEAERDRDTVPRWQADALVTAEREACAKLCDERVCLASAAAIRARGAR